MYPLITNLPIPMCLQSPHYFTYEGSLPHKQRPTKIGMTNLFSTYYTLNLYPPIDH